MTIQKRVSISLYSRPDITSLKVKNYAHLVFDGEKDDVYYANSVEFSDSPKAALKEALENALQYIAQKMMLEYEKQEVKGGD